MIYNYAIFHRGCPDGFAGYHILSRTKHINIDTIVYPDTPFATKAPPNIKGKDIIIIDTAYKYSVLKEICMKAKSVVFIDHHITIRNDVIKIKKELELKKNITIIYNEKKSGCLLTWEFFYPKLKKPLYIKYINDNDTGTWKYKETDYFMISLDIHFSKTNKEEVLEKWDAMNKSENVKKMVEEGKQYMIYMEHVALQNSKRCVMVSFPSKKIFTRFPKYFNKIGQYRVALYCGPACPDTKILFKTIMNNMNCDFVIFWTYSVNENKYVLSFRSLKVDVGSIASIFGGGGHTLASACNFSSKKYKLEDLFL
jgi:hypothetical protein